MAFDWSAAIGAAAQLVSSGGQMIASGKMNKKTRKLTEEQNALNRQMTWDMWNATNDFNLKTSDPAFIMQRFKNAGMNPWLTYGEPTGVKADTMSTQQEGIPDQKIASLDIAGAYEAFMNQKMRQKQLDSIQAEIDSKEAQTRVFDAQAGSINQDTDQKNVLFGGQQQIQSLDILNKTYSNQKIVEDIRKVGVDIGKTQAETKAMTVNMQKTLTEIDNLKKQGKLVEAEIKAKELANRLFQSTMESKADADNAYNKLMKNTGGVGKASMSQLPGIIIGGAVKMLSDPDVQSKIKRFKEDKKVVPTKDEFKQWYDKNRKK